MVLGWTESPPPPSWHPSVPALVYLAKSGEAGSVAAPENVEKTVLFQRSGATAAGTSGASQAVNARLNSLTFEPLRRYVP